MGRAGLGRAKAEPVRGRTRARGSKPKVGVADAPRPGAERRRGSIWRAEALLRERGPDAGTGSRPSRRPGAGHRSVVGTGAPTHVRGLDPGALDQRPASSDQFQCARQFSGACIRRLLMWWRAGRDVRRPASVGARRRSPPQSGSRARRRAALGARIVRGAADADSPSAPQRPIRQNEIRRQAHGLPDGRRPTAPTDPNAGRART